MTTNVKVKASLPKDDETNGLGESAVDEFVGNPRMPRVAIVVLQTQSITKSLATAEQVPTVAIQRIELVPDAEEAAGLGCSTGLCRWRKGPWRIALVSDERRLVEACSAADIVLATVDAQGRCRGPRLVIDRRDAWKEGAQAVWLDELGLRRQTGNGVRGDRPWVPNSPSRQALPVRAPGV